MILVENIAKQFSSIDVIFAPVVSYLACFSQRHFIIALGERFSVVQPFELPIFNVLALNMACQDCFFLYKLVFSALLVDLKR
jgi:hypothetical protein